MSNVQGKNDKIEITTNVTFFVVFCVTDISNGLTGHSGYSKTFEVMTATLPLLSKGSVAYFLAVHFYQGNPDR